jgi:acyl-CoA synthetase (AMP-forming)/AMP-acid ligase II
VTILDLFPKVIRIIDVLPRNALGKIERAELRSRVRLPSEQVPATVFPRKTGDT